MDIKTESEMGTISHIQLELPQKEDYGVVALIEEVRHRWSVDSAAFAAPLLLVVVGATIGIYSLIIGFDADSDSGRYTQPAIVAPQNSPTSVATAERSNRPSTDWIKAYPQFR